jgi:transcription initiation factor TFIIH subunit 1
MQTGIQPTTDGVNGIVYNLTTDLMDSIFKTYPAVLKKHKECVPALMTEAEFWAKFFQSHYFHRDRLPVSKDVFYSCARSDDKEMRKGVEGLRLGHSDIIEMIDDPNRVEDLAVDTNITAAEKDKESGVTAHRNMIKRYLMKNRFKLDS